MNKKEFTKIIKFIQKTLRKQKFEKVIIAVSGGIDSSTSLLLLSKAVNVKNIFVLKLPYGKQDMRLADLIIKKAEIPEKNVKEVNIKEAVGKITRLQGIRLQDKIRKGNIIARTRMIILYDQAKNLSALVCGTENKSEHILGYFTRFGDEASDFEPIRHLYKTQVFSLAKYLKVPQIIINQPPTAGLWPGQTDEKEMGFTYKEADQILYLYFEKQLSKEEIIKKGFKNTKKIIKRLKNNQFKHKTPYKLPSC